MLVESNRAAIARALNRGLASFSAPEPMTLRDWAERHFYLSAESSYVEQRWEAWPFQRAILACVGSDDVQEVDVIKSARVGYALALDTPIPTPTGWATMGSLKEGDRVFDEQGKPCRVTYKSPVYVDHECYVVRFDDGSEITADAGHRWSVECDQTIKYLLGERNYGRPRRDDVTAKRGIVDTETLARVLVTARGRSAVAIVNAGTLDLPRAALPIPPYTLGAWLGDGHLVTPRITQHRPDVEIAKYIKQEGIDATVKYIDARYPNNATIFLDIPKDSHRSPWAKIFRSLGLLNKKYVPTVYLRGSREQRLALLQGLMDTDGTVSKSTGRAEFCNTNQALAEGVYELVVSLGMKAYLSERPPQREGCLKQYRVGFKPSPACNPFRLKRKADLVRTLDRPSINGRRRVISVEPTAKVGVQCISVDSSSHLFLCGRGMIPTHNTKILLAGVGYFAEHKRRNQALWQPTDSARDEFVKTELEPMLRDVTVMHPIFPHRLSRHKDNTLLVKKFRGSVLHLRGGRSGDNYRRLSIGVAFLDEFSSFDSNIDGEGDPGQLAAKRLEGATFPKMVIGSTPKLKATCLMDKRAAGADARYVYHIKCPHCDEHHALTWGGKDEPHGFKWLEGDPDSVKHLCPHCGVFITQGEYLAAAETGFWFGSDGTTIDRDGVFRNADGEIIPAHKRVAFHVWTAYSPMVSWAKLVREFQDAYAKAVVGDDEPLKTFWNTTLGQAWEGEVETIEADELKRRAEIEAFRLPGKDDNLVPKDCLLLLAGCDTQGNRVEVGVWGFGRGGEMWTVDHQIFHGNPAEDEVWSNVAAYLFERRFQHECGQQMSIYATAIDSGGHHSNAVYDFARRNKARRVFAVRGRPFGEKAIKDGAGQVDIDWRGKRIKKGVILWHVGTNLAKDLLHSRLAIETPGPGYVHLSEDFSEEWFRQFSGEARVTRKTATGTRTLWTAMRKRVETLDCAVYALWVAEHLGLSRKSEAWWDALAAKLDALPPPAEDEGPARKEQPTPRTPAERRPQVAARAPPAPKPARRRAAPSSYLRGRR